MATLPHMPMAQDKCPLTGTPLRTKVYGTTFMCICMSTHVYVYVDMYMCMYMYRYICMYIPLAQDKCPL